MTFNIIINPTLAILIKQLVLMTILTKIQEHNGTTDFLWYFPSAYFSRFFSPNESRKPKNKMKIKSLKKENHRWLCGIKQTIIRLWDINVHTVNNKNINCLLSYLFIDTHTQNKDTQVLMISILTQCRHSSHSQFLFFLVLNSSRDEWLEAHRKNKNSDEEEENYFISIKTCRYRLML